MTPSAWVAEDGAHVVWAHRCRSSNGMITETWLPTDSNGWTVVSLDPITVTPSIYCHDCGTHGWITDGVWVKA